MHPRPEQLDIMMAAVEPGDLIVPDFALSFSVIKPNGKVIAVDRRGRISEPSPSIVRRWRNRGDDNERRVPLTTRGWTTFEIDWESYGKDYAEALKKAGYSSVEQYSDHYYVAQNATEHYIEIYCRRDEESKLPAFFIELSTHNRILTAFAENAVFLALEDRDEVAATGRVGPTSGIYAIRRISLLYFQ